MTDIHITKGTDLQVLNRAYNRAYRDALDTALLETADWLQRNSPRGASPSGSSLAGGWDVLPSRKQRNQLFASGKIVNRANDSLFRVIGRGPGQLPPYGPNSNLGRWATAKGIPPYLVARKIAQQGTDRWRQGAKGNILNLNPQTQTVEPGGEMERVFAGVLQRELGKVKI